MKINSAMKPVERMDSAVTTPGGDTEDTEFDSEAIITPVVDREVLDSQKPRMRGKKFTEWPMRRQDKDLSGLCSIM